MRQSSVVAVACLLAAACGGGSGAPSSAAHHRRTPPAIPAAVATRLASQADAVAASLNANRCPDAQRQAAALDQSVSDAIDQQQVPAALQRPLLQSVSSLVGRIACPPPKPKPKPHHEHHRQGGK